MAGHNAHDDHSDENEDYGFTAEFYDHVASYRQRDDIAFFVDAACDCGGPVLEVGCGTGRILIPIAREGIDITGLDLSDAMLDVCRQNLSEESEAVRSHVTLVKQDMRHIDLQRKFPLVTIPFRPFQHLITVADQMSCLESIRRHLPADGRLILDLFNPALPALVDDSRLAEFGEEPEFQLPDGRRVIRRSRIAGRDWYNQVQDTELIYYVSHPDGRQERLAHRFPMRYLFRFEAEHLLARCGFVVEALYADYARHPYGSHYPGELIFVARPGA